MAPTDPTLGNLASLSPRAQAAAYQLVLACRDAGLPVIITSALRDPATQRDLVARGLSKTLDSAHVRGEAFDIDWYGWDRRDIPQWFWQIVGPWAETQLGLRWGGRWRSLWDPGHFELP